MTAPERDGSRVTEPKWAVRIDYTTEQQSKERAAVRISDAADAASAAEDAFADLRARVPDAHVLRVESFAPSIKNLVPRGLLG